MYDQGSCPCSWQGISHLVPKHHMVGGLGWEEEEGVAVAMEKGHNFTEESQSAF